MTDHTSITSLTPVRRPLSHEPETVTKRLQSTLDEARRVSAIVRDLGVVLVGNQAPEPMRDHVGTSSRGLFETITSQADAIDRCFTDIRTVIENIQRRI